MEMYVCEPVTLKHRKMHTLKSYTNESGPLLSIMKMYII